MDTVTLTLATGDGQITTTLPAEDVLAAVILPAWRETDDGEWSWAMQELQPERLTAVYKFIAEAADLLRPEPAQAPTKEVTE